MAWLPFGQLPLECGEGFDGLSQTGRPAAPGLPAANRLAPVDEVQWFENHMRSAMPKALATLAGQALASIEDPVVIDKILTHLQEKLTAVAAGLRPASRPPPADLFG